MAFMFKGPASLTSGSVITDATSISSADLTVTDDLTIAQDLTVGDDITVTGDIVAASVTAKINEAVLKVTTTNLAGVYTTTDISNHNVLYLANIDDATSALTLKLTWPTVTDGHHIFIAWVAKNAGASTLKITFDNDVAGNTIYTGAGATGANQRVLNFNGLAQNCLFYYSSDLGIWLGNENNGATFATS